MAPYRYHNLKIGIFNPYWQIMENSTRNFSGIFIFRVVIQAVLVENSSRKISKISIFRGRPISGKLIQFFRDFNFGAMSLTDFWKTHPCVKALKNCLDEFSRNRSSSLPQNWNLEKIGCVFQKSVHTANLKKTESLIDLIGWFFHKLI